MFALVKNKGVCGGERSGQPGKERRGWKRLLLQSGDQGFTTTQTLAVLGKWQPLEWDCRGSVPPHQPSRVARSFSPP